MRNRCICYISVSKGSDIGWATTRYVKSLIKIYAKFIGMNILKGLMIPPQYFDNKKCETLFFG
ncbi:MAG: hypothetical protein JNL70_03270 [Saprospiraceae bacterium]|nr:hypothetical protein [Saprospiraceae bacterium]